jgi:type IV pilus assembly protein PilE
MNIRSKLSMMKQTTQPRMASSGFTLIELMITAGIVAILATIASAAYTSQVQKSRRTDARSALLDLAGREEKLYSTTNAYSATPSDLGYGGTPFPIPVGSGYYTVSATVANPPDSYLITATAIGTQASDSQCSTLSVNQLGVQSSTGTGTAATCWGN